MLSIAKHLSGTTCDKYSDLMLEQAPKSLCGGGGGV